MKKRIEQRRVRNRAIANHDAEQRCVSCRRVLPHGYLVLLGAAGQLRFCDENCRLDAAGAERVMKDARS